MQPKVAAIQMNASAELKKNLEQARFLIQKAVAAGADLAVLPENFSFMGQNEREKLTVKETFGSDEQTQAFLQQEAKRHGIWLVGGTIPLVSEENERVYSSTLVYDRAGTCVVRYDKIHLFDVSINTKETYKESSTIKPGREVVTFATEFGRVGLGICYDLRFPEFFREMLDNNISLIVLPAAFTWTTGKAHWELLCRARAVENLCYVVAANQCGTHPGGRQTYGHSMIVNPWGDVVGACEEEPDIVVAEYDTTLLSNLRTDFPVLMHRVIKARV